MRKNLFIRNTVTILIVMLVACTGWQKNGMARITERRANSNGRLQVRYEFMAGSIMVHDSVEMENTVLPNDSVPVRFNASNPRENQLRLPGE